MVPAKHFQSIWEALLCLLLLTKRCVTGTFSETLIATGLANDSIDKSEQSEQQGGSKYPLSSS